MSSDSSNGEEDLQILSLEEIRNMKKIVNKYRNCDSPCFVKPDAAQNLETLVQ